MHRDGLFFERLPNGDVRMVKTRDKKWPVDDSITGQHRDRT
jgi:hypothetical protein